MGSAHWDTPTTENLRYLPSFPHDHEGFKRCGFQFNSDGPELAVTIQTRAPEAFVLLLGKCTDDEYRKAMATEFRNIYRHLQWLLSHSLRAAPTQPAIANRNHTVSIPRDGDARDRNHTGYNSTRRRCTNSHPFTHVCTHANMRYVSLSVVVLDVSTLRSLSKCAMSAVVDFTSCSS
jgi:hypothetical protein